MSRKSYALQLETAICKGDVGAVQAHLDTGGSSNASIPNVGTLLHSAALAGQDEIVELLLASGAKVDAECFDGMRPLMLACLGGHLAVVRRLLAAGADARYNSKYEGGAIHRACYGQGSLEDRKTIIRLLIERGANVEAESDGRKLTPLLLANSPEIADCLVRECGANARALSPYGRTGLHNAANAGMARWWMEKQGVAVDARDQSGETPLHRATAAGRATVMACLIDNGADIEAMSASGHRPIHTALRNLEPLATFTLLEAGVATAGVPYPFEYSFAYRPTTEEALVASLSTAVLGKLLDPAAPISLRSGFSSKTIAMRALRAVLSRPLLLQAATATQELQARVDGSVMDRDGRLSLLGDAAWERRKHLVCFYVFERRKMKAGAVRSSAAQEVK